MLEQFEDSCFHMSKQGPYTHGHGLHRFLRPEHLNSLIQASTAGLNLTNVLLEVKQQTFDEDEAVTAVKDGSTSQFILWIKNGMWLKVMLR